MNTDNAIYKTTMNWSNLPNMDKFEIDSYRHARNCTSCIYNTVVKRGQEQMICCDDLRTETTDNENYTITVEKKTKWISLTHEGIKKEIQRQERKNRHIILLSIAAAIIVLALAAGVIALGVTVAPTLPCIMVSALIMSCSGLIPAMAVHTVDFNRIKRLQQALVDLQKDIDKAKSDNPDTSTQNPLYGTLN